MLDNRFFKNGHLTSLALLMLETNALTLDEKQLVLFHLTSCEECLQEYTDSLTDEALMEPPKELEQNTLNFVSQEFIKKKHNKILTIQMAKLAIAVSITMVLFFGGVFEFIGNVPLEMIKTNNQKQEQAEQLKEDNVRNFTQSVVEGFNQFAFQFNTSNKGEKRNESK